MKTIERVALATMFKDEQLDSIMEVVGYTPNPTIAIEKLLGIYVQPEFRAIGLKSKNGKSQEQIELTLESVDYWQEQVYYSYMYQPQKGLYIHKDVDETLVNADNYKEYELQYEDDDVKYIYINFGDMAVRKDVCSFREWSEYTYEYDKRESIL